MIKSVITESWNDVFSIDSIKELIDLIADEEGKNTGSNIILLNTFPGADVGNYFGRP